MHSATPEGLRRADEYEALDARDGSPGGGVVQTAASRPSVSSAALLQIWLSPSFPVGAFAYSHGLEQAVERQWVRDRASLEAWIADLARHGGLGNDLILLAEAWRAASERQWDRLAAAVELSAALQPSAERHLEATQQGRSFLDAVAAAWPCEVVTRLKGLLDGNAPRASVAATTGSCDEVRELPANIGYPVAVGGAAAGHGIPLTETLLAYAIAFANNLTSAAIRLGVIGQTDGQRVIATLVPALQKTAECADASTLDDLGGAVFRSDIASLAHETQYSRLFRS